jgi:hypothetical protein
MRKISSIGLLNSLISTLATAQTARISSFKKKKLRLSGNSTPKLLIGITLIGEISRLKKRCMEESLLT